MTARQVQAVPTVFAALARVDPPGGAAPRTPRDICKAKGLWRGAGDAMRPSAGSAGVSLARKRGGR
jgi:hypothetical protein